MILPCSVGINVFFSTLIYSLPILVRQNKIIETRLVQDRTWLYAMDRFRYNIWKKLWLYITDALWVEEYLHQEPASCVWKTQYVIGKRQCFHASLEEAPKIAKAPGSMVGLSI